MSQQQKPPTSPGYGTGSYLQSWNRWLKDNPHTNQNDQNHDDKQIAKQTTKKHANTTAVTKKTHSQPSFWQTFSSGASSVVMSATSKGLSYCT